MLLRRVSKHVKDQNWFAVFVDFFIVVVGILIAFQITNWSEEQQAKVREQAVILQLEEEFLEIKSAIEKQNLIREGYIKNIGLLIETLEGTESTLDDLTIKDALYSARSMGRKPAQSAAYLQLMSSGNLTSLTNENLQKALIRYDALLQRDSFVFVKLMDIVTDEFTSNPFVDYDISKVKYAGASIDLDKPLQNMSNVIRFYDLEGLRKFENRYETMYVLHKTILNSDKRLLVIVNEILNHISRKPK